jgi:hypothetical protein
LTSRFQPSSLFPLLFDKLEEDRHVTVFDAGLAVAETVDFFSSYHCSLHFPGLYSDPLVREFQHEALEKELVARFEQVLDFPAGTQFDICLFWDFFNYLCAPALHAFDIVFSRFIHSGTRAHAFGVHNRNAEIKHQHYGIGRQDTLVIKPGSGEQLRCFPHPPTSLGKLCPGWKVGRTTLLAGGQLEMLLQPAAEHGALTKASAGPGSLSA